MTVKGTDRDPEKTCNTDGCNAWATKKSGRTRCRNCGGESTGPKTKDGKEKSSKNSIKHGAYTDKSKLYSQVFDDLERKIADDIYEDYRKRYVEKHGDIPTGHDIRLSKISVNSVTEIRVENWVQDRPDKVDTGTPYVDEERRQKTAQMPDGTTKVIMEKRYKKSPALAAKKTLSNENRQWLKDLGLLDDPESQKADAMNNVAQMWEDDLK